MNSKVLNKTVNPAIVMILTEGGGPVATIPPMGDYRYLLSPLIFSVIAILENFAGENVNEVKLVAGGNKILFIKKAGLYFFAIIVDKEMEPHAKEFLNQIITSFKERFPVEKELLVVETKELREFEKQVMEEILKLTNIKKSDYFTSLRTISQKVFEEVKQRGLIPLSVQKRVKSTMYPELTDLSVLFKEKDPTMRKILEMCNGTIPIDEIAKKINISEAKLLILLSKYVKKKSITMKSGIYIIEET